MKTIKNNQQGIAHLGLILLFVLSVTLIGFAGYRVMGNDKQSSQNASVTSGDITDQTPTPLFVPTNEVASDVKASKEGTVSSVFSQTDPAVWPAGQTVGYVGLNVGEKGLSNVKKVEWYLNNLNEGSLKHTAQKPNVGTLFQYDWPMSQLPSGTYRWIAKVYDKDGNHQLAKGAAGNAYIDHVVDNNKPGKVSGEFVQRDKTSWLPTQGVAYIGLNINESGLKDVERVEWYVNEVSPSALKNTQYTPSVQTLFQYDWRLSGYKPGTYRWIAKVYDKDGNFQLVKNNLGRPYVDMTVQ